MAFLNPKINLKKYWEEKIDTIIAKEEDFYGSSTKGLIKEINTNEVNS